MVRVEVSLRYTNTMAKKISSSGRIDKANFKMVTPLETAMKSKYTSIMNGVVSEFAKNLSGLLSIGSKDDRSK